MAAHTVLKPIWSTLLACDNCATNGGFGIARAVARHWIASRHGGWPANIDPLKARWSPPGEGNYRIVTDTWVADAGQVWSATVDRDDEETPAIRWRTVITLCAHPDGKAMSIHVAHGFEPSARWLAAPPAYNPRRPQFIPKLLTQLSLTDAGVPITGRITTLTDPAAHLTNPARRLPIIVAGDGIDAARLADLTAGVAVTVRSTDMTGSELDMWERHNGRLPHPGRIIIAWAGPRLRCDLVGRVGEHDDSIERSAAKKVFGASTFAFSTDPKCDSIRSAALVRRERNERQAGINAGIAHANSIEQASDIGQLRTDHAATLEAYEADLARLDDLAERLERSEAERAVLASRLHGFETITAVSPTERRSFDTPIDAVRAAASDFPNHLRFHPRVWVALDGWEYPRPAELYTDLARFALVIARWQADDAADGLEALANDAGVPHYQRNTSPGTRAQYPSDYIVTIDGIDRPLDPHFGRGAVTAANCYRAYAWLDMDNRQAVIGWVGAHLRDSTKPT